MLQYKVVGSDAHENKLFESMWDAYCRADIENCLEILEYQVDTTGKAVRNTAVYLTDTLYSYVLVNNVDGSSSIEYSSEVLDNYESFGFDNEEHMLESMRAGTKPRNLFSEYSLCKPVKITLPESVSLVRDIAKLFADYDYNNGDVYSPLPIYISINPESNTISDVVDYGTTPDQFNGVELLVRIQPATTKEGAYSLISDNFKEILTVMYGHITGYTDGNFKGSLTPEADKALDKFRQAADSYDTYDAMSVLSAEDYFKDEDMKYLSARIKELGLTSMEALVEVLENAAMDSTVIPDADTYISENIIK